MILGMVLTLTLWMTTLSFPAVAEESKRHRHYRNQCKARWDVEGCLLDKMYADFHFLADEIDHICSRRHDSVCVEFRRDTGRGRQAAGGWMQEACGQAPDLLDCIKAISSVPEYKGRSYFVTEVHSKSIRRLTVRGSDDRYLAWNIVYEGYSPVVPLSYDRVNFLWIPEKPEITFSRSLRLEGDCQDFTSDLKDDGRPWQYLGNIVPEHLPDEGVSEDEMKRIYWQYEAFRFLTQHCHDGAVNLSSHD